MKPKSKLPRILLPLLILSLKSFGQTSGVTGLTTVIPPSPNVQAMQKYGDLPVSPYTGVPDISIPLYTVKFHDITVPISLSYHASGIKVTEEASNVGLGWALNAGGEISRNIVGYDDFNSGLYYFNSGNFSNGVFTESVLTALDIDKGLHPASTTEIHEDCNLSLVTKLFADSTVAISPSNVATIESQPDQYYFNIPGKNGKFILDRNYNAILEKQAKVKINCLNAMGTAWTITTEDGFVYSFAQSNQYETVKYTSFSSGDNIPRPVAYYLTQITSPTGNIVTFNYTSETGNVASSAGDWYELADVWENSVQLDATLVSFAASLTSAPEGATQLKFAPGNIYTTMHLSSIDYTSGRVVFSYTANRQDLPGASELNNVSVYSKDSQGNLSSAPLKSYAFNYSYFNGATDPGYITPPTPPAVSPTQLRLMLNSVTETGNYNGQTVAANPYVFTYYSSQNGSFDLPDKTSYSRDHWGYYNGYNSSHPTVSTQLMPTFHSGFDSNPANFYLGVPGNERDASPVYMQALSLQKIQYPTGGYTLFEYEANDCDEQLSEVNDHSGNPYLYSIVPSPKSANNSGVLQWYNPNFPGNPNTPQTLDNKNEYQVNGKIVNGSFNIAIRLDANTAIDNYITGGQIPYNVVTVTLTNLDSANYSKTFDAGGAYYLTNAPVPAPTGKYIVYGQDNIIQIYNLPSITPGRYSYSVSCSNSSFGSHVENVIANYNWYTQVNSNLVSSNPTMDNQVLYSTAGGLRIKRITDHDGINSDKIRKYSYHYFADKNGDGIKEEYTYGIRMSRPEYSYFETAYEDDATQLSNQGVMHHVFLGEHLMRSSDSNIALNGSAGGSVVGYSQVTELYGENGENGQTIYKYHNNPDEVDSYSFSTPLNGMVNGYTFRKRPYNSNIADPLNGSLIEQQDYSNVNSQLSLVKDVTNIYAVNSTVENKVYGFENKVPQTLAFLNGSPVPFPQALTNCQRFFYYYTPLQSEWTTLVSTDVKTYGLSNAATYQETLTRYFYDNPLHYLPTRVAVNNSDGNIITTKTTYPLDYTVFNAADPISNGIQNLIAKNIVTAPIEKYVQITDGNGNNPRVVSAMLSSYGTGLPLLNTVYQMQTPMPVTNFTPLLFTTSSTTKNNTYQPLIFFNNYDSYGNLLQQNKNLDISYSYQWGYNNNYPVAQCKNAAPNEFYYQGFEDLTGSTIVTGSGHTGSKSSTATTISWTLPNSRSYVITYWYLNSAGIWTLAPEQPYTGSSFNLAIAGATAYDDIRIFPSDAQMTTYTYDPLVGVTSSTDAKGMTTFFEYDGLQRLMNVKDKDGNIVKNYKYHYEPQVQ